MMSTYSLFKDDYEILKECEKYFNINLDSIENTIKNDVKSNVALQDDDIYDLKIQINHLKNDNNKLSQENSLLNQKIQLSSNNFKYISLDLPYNKLNIASK